MMGKTSYHSQPIIRQFEGLLMFISNGVNFVLTRCKVNRL